MTVSVSEFFVRETIKNKRLKKPLLIYLKAYFYHKKFQRFSHLSFIVGVGQFIIGFHYEADRSNFSNKWERKDFSGRVQRISLAVYKGFHRAGSAGFEISTCCHTAKKLIDFEIKVFVLQKLSLIRHI